MSPTLNCPICFFRRPFQFQIAFQLSFCTGSLICICFTNLIHLRSVFILTSTLGTSYRCTKGYFTQCHSVAHNLRISDFPQSAELFLFTFYYFAPMGHHSVPILAQYGAITIPYSCCFVLGIYHPVHFQWGINPSHSWLLFVAHYISHH